jgi:hypothetical protein
LNDSLVASDFQQGVLSGRFVTRLS